MESGRLYKLAAFTNRYDGGNPAGVWIGEKLPNSGIMHSNLIDGKFEHNLFKLSYTGV
jgi:hypothetical protein